jgi:hypothetical protein
VHVFNPPGSRLAEKNTRYRIVLSGEPKKYSDNKLIRYTLEAMWMRDSLATTRFVFTPDKPVPSKELSISGDLELNAGFTDGRDDTALGRFENNIIDVLLTDTPKAGKPRQFHIKWNAAGEPISQEHAD